ncbi:MAG: hypothetical protein HXX19_18250 [Rhodoferax sp.]|nr:hypothetical protein [Rhodoferax sp.]
MNVRFAIDPLTGKATSLAMPDGGNVAVGIGLLTGVSNATANTAALQSVLNSAGIVTVFGPGTCHINSTLLLSSNTSLVISAGLTLKLADAVNDNLFRNVNALTTPITLGAGELTFTGLTATIAHTGIDTLYPVGSYIGINGSTTKGFNGVWQITSTASGQVSFALPVAPAASPAVGTILVAPADTNISISGKGTIDANGANQTSGANPRKDYGTFIRNARFVSFRDFSGKLAKQWFICTSNVEDYSVDGVYINSARVVGSDPIHLTGPHRRVLINNIKTYAADNCVGLTIEAAGTFTDMQPGDMYDVKLQNINVDTTAAAIALWGAPNFYFDSFTLDGLYGSTTSGGFKTAPFPPQGMTATGGGTLSLKNIGINTASDVINIGGGGAWDKIIVDGVDATSDQVIVNCSQTVGTVKDMAISNIRSRVARTTAAIQLQNMPIDYLKVSDIKGDNFGASYLMTGGGTGKSVTLENVSITTTGGMYYAANSGALERLYYRNCYQYGTGGAGMMFRQGATSAVKSVTFEGCGGNALKDLFDGANTTQAITVFMNDIELTSCARAGIFAGPTTLAVNGYREITGMTNNPFQALTTATAYDFSFSNVSSLKTDLIGFTAGANLRMRGGFTAGSNVTAPTASDQFYAIDTTTSGSASIGQKGRTNAGAWAALF